MGPDRPDAVRCTLKQVINSHQSCYQPDGGKTWRQNSLFRKMPYVKSLYPYPMRCDRMLQRWDCFCSIAVYFNQGLHGIAAKSAAPREACRVFYKGMHLRLPGFGDNGPTLEIYQFENGGGAKACLEHGINLNLIADRFPDGH
jgi:hypothetical protein